MTGTMRPRLQPPLTPFVDPLPLPRRILAGQGGGELTVRIRAAAHRFHRDLPESRVWAYEGLVPGPTVEAERGQPVRVCWRNEIDQPYPVVVTLAPAETDGDGGTGAVPRSPLSRFPFPEGAEAEEPTGS